LEELNGDCEELNNRKVAGACEEESQCFDCELHREALLIILCVHKPVEFKYKLGKNLLRHSRAIKLCTVRRATKIYLQALRIRLE
jgi:hypothetical protein